MRKSKGANWKKRGISIILTLGMLLGMLEISGLGSISSAVKDSDKTSSYADNQVSRVRAVINTLSEIPGAATAATANDATWDSWVKNTWNNGTKGEINRPFTILEIVPYAEYAEFGYMIEGCEPVDFSKLQGYEGLYSVSNLSATKEMMEFSMPTNAYFFGDEKEGMKEYYYRYEGNVKKYRQDTLNKLTSYKKIYGYYEVVATESDTSAEGDFKLVEDATTHKFTFKKVNKPLEKGNLVWHTLNDFVIDRLEADGVKPDFYDKIDNMTAEQVATAFTNTNFNSNEIGKRFYTFREGSTTDPYYNVGNSLYFDYYNKDVFATDIIGLSKQEAQSYSIYIKTITPAELNATNGKRWIDVADLIYINAKSSLSDYLKLWQSKDYQGNPANRLQIAGTLTSTTPEGYTGKYGAESPYNGQYKDLNWDVTEKIVRKVGAAQNYCGIIFHSNIFTGSNLTTKSVTYRRYDVNNNLITTEAASGAIDGYKENIGKLLVMTTTLNPNLINKIFLDNGRIEVKKDGTYSYGYMKGRTEDEGLYWSGLTFYIGSATIDQVKGNNLGSATDPSGKYWRDYTGRVYLSVSGTNTYVQGHAYIFNGNMSIATDIVTGATGASESIFEDFNSYIDTNAKTKEIWIKRHLGKELEGRVYTDEARLASYYDRKISSSNISPFAALRYILDMDSDRAPYYYDSVRVLEIEPSCGLNSDYSPYWRLTKEEVYLMVPNCSGDVTIDSMTMNSFVGRIDDLNETYDLIYLGDEADGYFLTPEYKGSDEQKAGMSRQDFYKKHTEARTDFYGTELDGLIYFQTGAVAYVGSADRANDANFIHGHNTGSQFRQNGNDLTHLKEKDLLSFIKAGYPIVAADHLFVDGYVESSKIGSEYTCVMYSFLKDNKASQNEDGSYTDGIFVSSQVAGIDTRVRNKKSRKMTISNSPKEYDGTLSSYLPKNGDYGVLDFQVIVPDTENYRYRIYVDKDRNSKCEAFADAKKNEVVRERDLTETTTNIHLEVNDSWVGFIQWKIEVFDKHNENIRVTKVGCSAIPAGENKNIIKALEITPDNSNYGNEDMRTGSNSPWDQLFSEVVDFDITVNRVKMSDFQNLFKDIRDENNNKVKFKFNMGKEIFLDEEHPADSNPNTTVLTNLESKLIGGLPLSEYNMIIIGFQDEYGKTDVSNANGAAEYLFYYAQKNEKSCSILFTHDLTCYYNSKSYGYTANTMLREIMGMSVYGGLSDRLYTDRANFREDLAANLEGYKTLSGAKYSKTVRNEIQGYTTFCGLKKLGAGGYKATGLGGSQYYYLINEPNGRFVDTTYGGQSSGGDNNQSNWTLRLNKGQITQYPFQIPEKLKVASTHCQYFALNMEDPEVTCWYTIEYPPQLGKNENKNTSATDGKGLVMAVDPQNASNNYYIYSKGNIYYSGVGHTDLGDSKTDEMRLFVNTLIAAYRPQFYAPEVEVTGPNAGLVAARSYRIYLEQEFNYDGGSSPDLANIDDEEYVYVTFKPKDASGCDKVSVKVYHDENVNDKYTIHSLRIADGKKVAGGEASLDPGKGDKVYLLNVDTEYVIKYKKTDLAAGRNHLTFEAENSVTIGVSGKTKLEIKAKPLFKLD
jgi:hypothetical protein